MLQDRNSPDPCPSEDNEKYLQVSDREQWRVKRVGKEGFGDMTWGRGGTSHVDVLGEGTVRPPA